MEGKKDELAKRPQLEAWRSLQNRHRIITYSIVSMEVPIKVLHPSNYNVNKKSQKHSNHRPSIHRRDLLLIGAHPRCSQTFLPARNKREGLRALCPKVVLITIDIDLITRLNDKSLIFVDFGTICLVHCFSYGDRESTVFRAYCNVMRTKVIPAYCLAGWTQVGEWKAAVP